tara:strand:+ start:362 stop:505 length:144 start_codon:yes stop_codon:yes gene_type:complete
VSIVVYYVIFIIKKYKTSSPPPKVPINPRLPIIGSKDLKNFELKLSR